MARNLASGRLTEFCPPQPRPWGVPKAACMRHRRREEAGPGFQRSDFCRNPTMGPSCGVPPLGGPNIASPSSGDHVGCPRARNPMCSFCRDADGVSECSRPSEIIGEAPREHNIESKRGIHCQSIFDNIFGDVLLGCRSMVVGEHIIDKPHRPSRVQCSMFASNMPMRCVC